MHSPAKFKLAVSQWTRARHLCHIVIVVLLFAVLGGRAVGARAGTLTFQVCHHSSASSGDLKFVVRGGIEAAAECAPGNPGLELLTLSRVAHGARGTWSTTTPAGIFITGARTFGNYSHGVGDGSGFTGAFYWTGGSHALSDTFTARGLDVFGLHTRTFGWFVSCARNTGCSSRAVTRVGELVLTALEAAAPRLTPSGALWTASGWLRGVLPIALSATDPSGVCNSVVLAGSRRMQGPISIPEQSRWRQCPQEQWSSSLDTSVLTGTVGLGQGQTSILVSATDAAGNTSSVRRSLFIDNLTPTVRLSGPSDAPQGQSPHFITATATAGPSGVAGIQCSLDGSATQWYPGSAVTLAVSGVGLHTAFCYSTNNARDVAGHVATSPIEAFSMHVRAISQARMWFMTGTASQPTSDRVPHGSSVVVAGRVTTAPRVAPAGATITILAAPASNPLALRRVTTARVGSGGGWSARVPAGPSRVVMATFAGTALIEPTISNLITETVPAKIIVSVTPRRLHWGGVIHISGRLLGGYVPASGEAVSLYAGWRGGSAYIKPLYSDSAGRFSGAFRFLHGGGTQTYSIWATSARESDYPYAPASSNRISVTVGP